MSRGIYISLDGPDGCGKSTQAAILAERRGAVLTREPGGTTVGRLIRSILLDPAHEFMDPEVDVLLLSADRRQHIAEVVGPALLAGRDVVSDRSFYSTYLYQGYGFRVPKLYIMTATWLAVGRTRPDVPIFIDIDYRTAESRLAVKLADRYEKENRLLHERVRNGIYSLAREIGDKAIVVDGSGREKDDIAQEIREQVEERVSRLDLE